MQPAILLFVLYISLFCSHTLGADADGGESEATRQTWDFIVVGAGAAGCVIAARYDVLSD